MSDLVNKIAEGKAVLLSADDICERLSISRSTFDRWVRNSSKETPLIREAIREIQGGGARRKSLFPIENDDESKISFPQPDIRIGNSLRWSIDTFKQWLMNNLSAQK
jgi:predicted DNA-binding transcriptional regulator AlpA